MNKYFLILCAGLFSFGFTLRGGFIWDDHEMIVKNEQIQNFNLQNIGQAFRGDVFNGKGDDYYRPLQTLQNMLDFKIWKFNPLGFHLTNLAFHFTAAFLLFGILSLLFKENEALMAALIFAVHPIVVEQLLIIAGRAELMAFAFSLAALRAAMYRTRWGFIFSILFYLLACLSKETGLIFPAFLFLVGLFNPQYKVRWTHYAAYAVIAGLYLFLRGHVVPNGEIVPDWRFAPIFIIRDFPMIVVEYLRVIIFPFDLHSHRRMNFSVNILIISYLVLGLVILKGFLGKSKLMWFCVGWFLIGLLPKLPVLMSNALMLDHWAYPSGVGIFIFMAAALGKLKRKMVVPVATVFIILFYSAISWANIAGRNTDKKMYEWALTYKSSSIVRANLGVIYYSEGRYVEAEELFKESLKMNPSPFSANGLALVYWKTGRQEEAIQLLDEFIKRFPDHAQSHQNRALILKQD